MRLGEVKEAAWAASVRDEESLLAQQATARRRAAAAASAKPDAGASRASAPAQPRVEGLWSLPNLPSEAEVAQQAWRTATKEQSATVLEEAQRRLAAEVGSAERELLEELANVQRAAAAELALVQSRLERSLAQSNAALALSLSRLEQGGPS
jgi:hypothetical protein